MKLHIGVVLATALCLSGHGTAAAQVQDGAIEAYERQSSALQILEEKVTRASIEPVVAALRRGSEGDPEILRLLSRIEFTATPHLMRPGNAYASRPRRVASGGTVEIDLGWFQQAFSIGEAASFVAIDPTGERKLMYSVGFNYGRELAEAIADARNPPNFSIDINDYLSDPLELSFVRGFGTRITDEAMAWTVLHEVAHHELGHLTPGKFDSSNATSRQLELDADDWAHRKMEELDIPLFGVMQFMQMMDVLDQIQAQVGFGFDESESTHPTWARRLSHLTSNYDTTKSTTKSSYKIFMSKLNVAAPGAPANIKRIAYASPRNSKEFACIGFVMFDDVQEIAIAEQSGDAVHLLQVPPGELIEVTILEPDRAVSHIQTTVTNRATGEVMQGTLLAWEQPMALYGEVTKAGIRVGEVMQISPRSMIGEALDETVTDPKTKRNALAALDKKLESDCEIAIAFGRGQLEMQEMMSRSQSVAQTYSDDLNRILGERDFARLQSTIMASPLVQSGLRQFQKLVTVPTDQ